MVMTRSTATMTPMTMLKIPKASGDMYWAKSWAWISITHKTDMNAGFREIKEMIGLLSSKLDKKVDK